MSWITQLKDTLARKRSGHELAETTRRRTPARRLPRATAGTG
jgi:hypothetical protein